MKINDDTAFSSPTTHICRTSNDHEIYFYDYGGSGPTILFAHAASFSGRIWDQVISHLRPDYRCVSFDFRGHGQSSGSFTNPAEVSQVWASMFADIADVTDQLAVEGPIFGVGHSLGGAGLVSAQLANPTLLRSLWVYEPIVFELNPFFSAICEDMARAAEERKPSFLSAQEAVDNFAPRPPFNAVDPQVLQDYIEYGFVADNGMLRLRCPAEVEAATYRGAADLDVFDQTSEIEIGVCVATGSTDPQAIHLGHELSKKIPAGVSMTLDGLGHLGPLENPSKIAVSISGFFGSY